MWKPSNERYVLEYNLQLSDYFYTSKDNASINKYLVMSIVPTNCKASIVSVPLLSPDICTKENEDRVQKAFENFVRTIDEVHRNAR